MNILEFVVVLRPEIFFIFLYNFLKLCKEKIIQVIHIEII